MPTMQRHELLGQISHLHQMMTHLMESIPEQDCYRRFDPDLPPMAWLWGRSTYLETYWLREVVQEDDDMTARVRHLFGHDVACSDEILAQLPPMEHLMNWALELQDENLMRLANPAMLPAEHPLLVNDRLLLLILQQHAQNYELMLMQLTERRINETASYQPSQFLTEQPPSTEHVDLHKGHYRIGAKDDVAAFDNELPVQMVQLDAFRMDKHPVTNGAWLGFLRAGGYEESSLWSTEGWQWLQEQPHKHPRTWKKDLLGNWYGVGLNGPYDLAPQNAVVGISHHEALAYANWVATQGEQLAGAVLQHEYQWEIAARAQEISGHHAVWEWCSNVFEAYVGYGAPTLAEAATRTFDGEHYTLRGGSLHTQPVLHRPSYRSAALPHQRFHFSGTRLVFPPSDMPWHK